MFWLFLELSNLGLLKGVAQAEEEHSDPAQRRFRLHFANNVHLRSACVSPGPEGLCGDGQENTPVEAGH